MVAGSTLGLGGTLVLPGCETVGTLVAAAVHVCVPIIRSLIKLPTPELPPGYSPCGDPVVWQERGHTATFCLYCSPFEPAKVYLQMNCTGDYYPLELRPLGSPAAVSFEEGVHLEKLGCEEQLLIRVRSAYDAWSGRATASFECPNERIFPDPSRYETLTVSVDGKQVADDRDFEVMFGGEVELAGSLDEVAHYAMSAGLRELSFRADGGLYEVSLNNRLSAMMVFKDGAWIDTRFLFAPAP